MLTQSLAERIIIVISNVSTPIRHHQGNDVIVSMSSSIMVHHTMYIKPGGVPDKLCVFPTDES